MPQQNQDLTIRHSAGHAEEPQTGWFSPAPADTLVDDSDFLSLEITPKAILAGLSVFIVFLLLANLAMILLTFHFQYDDVHGLTRVFSFSDEKNIPTLFSSFGLIFCAALLGVIAVRRKKSGSSYLPWSGLAVVFLFLSIDETASLHEKFTIPIREALNTTGLLYFAWVIPYGVALIFFGLLYSRFLIGLPRRTMVLFMISGTIYIAGAMGLEMVGALRAATHGDDLIYQLIVTCEEFLEMLGIIVFIYSLLAYIVEPLERLKIVLTANGGDFLAREKLTREVER